MPGKRANRITATRGHRAIDSSARIVLFTGAGRERIVAQTSRSTAGWRVAAPGDERDRDGCRHPAGASRRHNDAGTDRRAQLRAHPRPWRSGGLHQPARRAGRGGGGEGARVPRPAALRHPGRREGQYRREGPADHGGVRSPYGVPRNTLDPTLIPGGSSSGSAVAVAAGLVPLALGTDTAGSGRVPAGLNNIVGLKPSLGLVSTAGVVPACRSLDCVSIFALTTDDAWMALAAIAGPDADDPYSRDWPLGTVGAFAKDVRIGVPVASQRIFFGDGASA